MKNIQIEKIKKTLNQETVDYLEHKMQDTTHVDLREISIKARNELKKAENEASFDFIKIKEESKRLMTEIDQSDTILTSLDNLLINFRDNLAVIKTEMSSLQEKSNAMNIRLGNRKSLANEFSEFVESFMLEPKLIENILKAKIDQEYIKTISKLSKKLSNLKRYDTLENQSVKEIEPELNKLKSRAAERLRVFMLEQIDKLGMTGANIQEIQAKDLLPYRVFLYFLKENNKHSFDELSMVYSKLLSKIYANNFRVYLDDLSEMLDIRYTHKYVLFPDNSAIYKNSNFYVYFVDERLEKIKEANEQLIMANTDIKPYDIEMIFNSLNKLLTATVIQEYTFCQNFFCLDDTESLEFFNSIFKPTITFISTKVKTWINDTNDVYGVLLIAFLYLQKKEMLKQRKFIVLSHYFNQIEALLWPKLNDLFEFLFSSINKTSSRILKQIVDNITDDKFLIRTVNFLKGCNSIKQLLKTSNFLFNTKISKLVSIIIMKIDQMSKEAIIEKEIMSIYIKYMHLLSKGVRNLSDFPKETTEKPDKLLNKTIEKFCDKIIEEYFEKLYVFLTKKNIDSINLTKVEEIHKDFNKSWMLKLGNMRNEIEYKFKSVEISSQMLFLINERILETYQEFFNFVKGAYPTYTSNLYPPHRLGVDIKGVIND